MRNTGTCVDHLPEQETQVDAPGVYPGGGGGFAEGITEQVEHEVQSCVFSIDFFQCRHWLTLD